MHLFHYQLQFILNDLLLFMEAEILRAGFLFRIGVGDLDSQNLLVVIATLDVTRDNTL